MKTRIEQAVVEYDECAGCGATERTGAKIGDESFDPRSRSGGFEPVLLWPSHPWDCKSLCRKCWKAKPFVLPDVPSMVVGGVRVRVFDVERCCDCDGKGTCSHRYCQGGWIYNQTGLRLSSAPPDPEEVDKHFHSALYRVGDRAVVLHERHEHWLPTSCNVGRLSDDWMRDLEQGERKVMVCERTLATPWPTVLEPLLPSGSWADEMEEADPERWGQDLCRRAERDDRGGRYAYLTPCTLRVPMEILQ
jgi:hypothetical protein